MLQKGFLLSFLLVAICFRQSAVAQVFGRSDHFWELGILAGATNYSGDLAEEHIEIKQTSVGGGFFARYHLNDFLFIRGQLWTGRIFGDDKNAPSRADRQFRYKSQLFESFVALESVPGGLKRDPVAGGYSYYLFPFAYIGAGAVYTRPEVTYYGPEERREAYIREPFPEEGKSSYVLPIIPMGLGLKMIYGDRVCFSVDVSARPVLSDLLDGISQNGNPDESDWYYSVNFGFSYFLQPWRPSPGRF